MITLNKQQALSVASLISCAANPKNHDAFAYVYIEYDPTTNLVRAVATDKYVLAQVSFDMIDTEIKPTEKAFAVLSKTDIANLKDLTKHKTSAKFVITNRQLHNNTTIHSLSNPYETPADLPSMYETIFTNIANSMINMRPATPTNDRPIDLSMPRLAQLTKLVPPSVIERKADDVFTMHHVGFSESNKPMPVRFERPGIVAMIQPMLSAK